jgi:hypothetical protein
MCSTVLPNERCGFSVVPVEVFSDGGDQLFDATEGAAPDPFFG